MFERVRAVDSSWNRLALHRADRPVDGVWTETPETDGRPDAQSVPLLRKRTPAEFLWPGNAELARAVRRSEIASQRTRKVRRELHLEDSTRDML